MSKIGNIASFSKRQLLAELKKRENDKPLPLPRKKQNVSGTKALRKLCEKYRDFVLSDDYCDDNDFSDYFFETALTAHFGDDFFKWAKQINRRRNR